MTLSTRQIEMLEAPLERKNVKARRQGNRDVSFIEGWHALAEANRIFGFGDWSSETIDMQLVCQGERQSNGRALQTCTYRARCRVTVYAGDRVIIREGFGAGHGMDQDAGQAHEKAVKEAETDARKRALMTFGNAFGLALYDKDQRNVADIADEQPAPAKETPRTAKRPAQPQSTDAPKEAVREYARPPEPAAKPVVPSGSKGAYDELAADVGKIKASLMHGNRIAAGRAIHEFEHWKSRARAAWGGLSVDHRKRVSRAQQEVAKLIDEHNAQKVPDDVARTEDTEEAAA